MDRGERWGEGMLEYDGVGRLEVGIYRKGVGGNEKRGGGGGGLSRVYVVGNGDTHLRERG